MTYLVNSLPTNAGTQEMWVQSLGWEEIVEKKMATCSSIQPRKFHGQRSPWVCKESDMTELTCIIKVRVSFPGSSVGKESACNAGDLGSNPGL